MCAANLAAPGAPNEDLNFGDPLQEDLTIYINWRYIWGYHGNIVGI